MISTANRWAATSSIPCSTTIGSPGSGGMRQMLPWWHTALLCSCFIPCSNAITSHTEAPVPGCAAGAIMMLLVLMCCWHRPAAPQCMTSAAMTSNTNIRCVAEPVSYTTVLPVVMGIRQRCNWQLWRSAELGCAACIMVGFILPALHQLSTFCGYGRLG